RIGTVMVSRTRPNAIFTLSVTVSPSWTLAMSTSNRSMMAIHSLHGAGTEVDRGRTSRSARQARRKEPLDPQRRFPLRGSHGDAGCVRHQAAESSQNGG